MNIVKELRKKKNIQQKELALILNVSQPTVSEWESGTKDPSGERLQKLADFFGVDELVILGRNIVTGSEEEPKTEEAKILAKGIDQLPKEQREQALNVIRAMFAQNSDLFEGREGR